MINFYKSLSYLTAKILPEKLFRTNKEENKIAHSQTAELKIQQPTPNLNIIFVLGESLRSQNLSIFGYPFMTSEKLNKWLNKEGLLAFKTISGSVATGVSLPLLFNDAYDDSSTQVILNSSKCLFSLAKKNGFDTTFYSQQTGAALKEIISYLCPTFANRFQTAAKSIGYDEELLTKLKNIDLNAGRNFVVLHQNGSHDPYKTKYPLNFVLRMPDASDDLVTARMKEYDNSIYYTHYVLSEILDYLQKNTNATVPTILIFTSDHGESLGENGVWGHVHLKDNFVYSVPFFIWSSDPTNAAYLKLKSLLPQKSYLTHSTISSLLVNLMGYDEKIDTEEKNFKVMGPDLFGEGGFVIVPTGKMAEREGFEPSLRF